MALNRETVIALKAEADEGVQEALTAAETIEVRVAPSVNPNIGEVERETSSPTLSEPVAVAGLRSATMSIPMDLSGRAANSPVFRELLRACSTKMTVGKALPILSVFDAGNLISHEEIVTGTVSAATGRTIGPVAGVLPGGEGNAIGTPWHFVEELTGTFVNTENYEAAPGRISDGDSSRSIEDAYCFEPWDVPEVGVAAGAATGTCTAGDLVIGDTSGGRGRLIADYTGPGTMRIEPLLGSPAFESGEELYCYADLDDVRTDEGPGGTLGANSDGNATASANQVRVELPSLTIGAFVKGVEQTLVGARGNVQIQANNGQSPTITFEMTGLLVEPLEHMSFDTVAEAPQAPHLVMGSRFWLDRQPRACFSQLQFSSEHDVSLRECQDDPSDTGYRSAIHSSRKWGGQMDPETVSEGLYPYLGNAWNKTAVRLEWQIGDGGDGKSIMVRAHKTQFGNPSQGDRSNLRTTQIPFRSRRSGIYRDEFFLYVF